ncbi:unnamed protein product [Lathyrus oleraceus]
MHNNSEAVRRIMRKRFKECYQILIFFSSVNVTRAALQGETVHIR